MWISILTEGITPEPSTIIQATRPHYIIYLDRITESQHYLLTKVSSFFPTSLLSTVDVVGAAGWVVETFGATHLSLAPMGTAGWVKGQFGVLHDEP